MSVFPTVYRNLGNGRFAKVSGRTGLNQIDRQTGYPRAFPLAVAAVDANGDGRLDLLFKYQSGDDALFINQADGTFRPWTPPAQQRIEGACAALAGAASFPPMRQSQAGSRLDVLREAALALAPSADEPACRLASKLGVALLDYDLDGRLDIVTANGLAEPGLDRFEHGRSFVSAPALLWNSGHGWVPVPTATGGARPASLIGRGVAVADIDGNGNLAVVIGQNGGRPRLYRNEQASGPCLAESRLVGTHRQRDAGGARVEAYTPRGVLIRTMEPAMGFMAQSEKTLTFGLGDDNRVRTIVVRWPSGERQEVRPAGVNRRIVITEPQVEVGRRDGRCPRAAAFRPILTRSPATSAFREVADWAIVDEVSAPPSPIEIHTIFDCPRRAVSGAAHPRLRRQTRSLTGTSRRSTPPGSACNLPPLAALLFATYHVAIFDTVNGIARTHQGWLVNEPRAGGRRYGRGHRERGVHGPECALGHHQPTHRPGGV